MTLPPNSSDKKSQDRGGKNKSSVSMSMLMGVGFSLCFEVAIAGYLGWLIGNHLDERFESSQLFTISMLILFLSASIFHLVNVLRKLLNRMEEEE